MTEAFLDSSYAIALVSPADLHHARARDLAGRLKAERARMITTHAVLFEIGNSLSRQRYRRAAVRLLHEIERDPRIEVVPVSEPLYEQALGLFAQRDDKEWGMTDCISFVVMQQRGLVQALTADDHFRQASFRALLLEQ